MRQKMINQIWKSIEELELSVRDVERHRRDGMESLMKEACDLNNAFNALAKENSALKRRIGRLENQPKYAVGDVVKFDPNKKPNIFSPLWDLGYVDQPVLTGKIKWIEYKGDEIRPTYRIFCPEAEETYTVGGCCIIKKEEPKNIQPKKKGNK